ncbi:MAG: choline-sulfatase [Geminicoccaceae bacterium]
MPSRRPNILLVMADQLSAGYLPSYGHAVVKASAMTRLATEGVQFDHAYCPSPLCAPSRFATMTGRLPSATGAYDNAAEQRSSVPTMAHALRRLGYRTCLAGKMHFVGPDQLHGFEERLTTDIYPADFGWTPNWDAPDERIDWWYHNMGSVKQAGTALATNQLDYDDEVAFRAQRWLQDTARDPDERPFLFVVSFTHPHDPYVVRPEHWDRYREEEIDPPQVAALPEEHLDAHSRRLRRVSAMSETVIDEADIRRARRAYYGAISYVDDKLADLVTALDRLGLAEDTITVVTADHGDMLGERGLWYKMHFFEASLRVPLIVHAPDRFRPHRVRTPVSLVDLLPTFVALGGGLEPGEREAVQGDGGDLTPLLEGGSEDPVRTVRAEYLAEGTPAPMLMLRRGDLKFVWCETDPPLLYDLAADPLELRNLAAEPDQAGLVATLTAEVHERWDTAALKEAVILSQRQRRLAWQALMMGRHTSWDYQPHTDASRQYMRNHLDLNELEASRRFPPPKP